MHEDPQSGNYYQVYADLYAGIVSSQSADECGLQSSVCFVYEVSFVDCGCLCTSSVASLVESNRMKMSVNMEYYVHVIIGTIYQNIPLSRGTRL